MNKKRILFFVGLFALLFVFADASLANAGTGLSGAADTAKTEVRGVIKGWQWVFAFMPFALALFVTNKVREHFEAKDEQSNGQSEPKVSRYAKMALAFVGSVVICYILYGLFGMVFAKQTFGAMWQKLVVDFWVAIFS